MSNNPPENISWSPDADERQYLDSPFGARKTAPQFTQLSIDPSQGLTRKRYGWWSNGTLFDETLFSDVESGIRLETTATGTDEARIRSAYPGQYISQSVAQPGLGLVVDDANVEIDASGNISLTHGEIHAGAFYWDDAGDAPDTGLGWTWDASGWEFFIKSLGSHIGPSPIPQTAFGIDRGDGNDWSGRLLDPSHGYIWNFPHTWYNEGPLSGAWVNPTNNHIEELVRGVVNGRPSVDTPNLPIQLVARNAGTGQSLGVELGGMQYSTYGSGRDDLERRGTDETRVGDSLVTTQRTLTENAIDPTSEPGTPLISAQREAGREDLNLRSTRIRAKPVGGDIYIFAWDEYDPDTALTGASFTDPISPNNVGLESHIVTDTQATDYAPEVAVFRGIEPFDGGTGNNVSAKDSDIDERIPIGATRVFTAVTEENANIDLKPIEVTFEEGY